MWPSWVGSGTCRSCAQAVRACDSAAACCGLALTLGCAAVHARTESCIVGAEHTSLHAMFPNSAMRCKMLAAARLLVMTAHRLCTAAERHPMTATATLSAGV
jgi:hypothetical protein